MQWRQYCSRLILCLTWYYSTYDLHVNLFKIAEYMYLHELIFNRTILCMHYDTYFIEGPSLYKKAGSKFNLFFFLIFTCALVWENLPSTSFWPVWNVSYMHKLFLFVWIHGTLIYIDCIYNIEVVLFRIPVFIFVVQYIVITVSNAYEYYYKPIKYHEPSQFCCSLY